MTKHSPLLGCGSNRLRVKWRLEGRKFSAMPVGVGAVAPPKRVCPAMVR